MARGTTAPTKTFHSPLLIDWTEEKLVALEKDQLLNLLANLEHQFSIGRLNEATAEIMRKRIGSFLTKRKSGKRVDKAGA
ncbi:MAG TPA: hypothetical protein VMG60_07395 [Burkholderiaceae bacterium]|nr:hypothetical protein [Burkholderiaceae bacterium]